jgi:polyribonucleotide nucleotidyltransferase
LEVLNETYNISGTNFTFESGKLALLINGSVMISSGYNILLTTA